MVDIWKVVIPELTGEDERNVYLYLPEDYRFDTKIRYPVLYMFDGHNVFFDSHATYGKCWGLKEYMDRTKTPMLICAVECNHSADHGRLKEYAPFSFSDESLGRITGKGDITMKWMTKTLKPYIDENYRTLPERENTYIAGSSMGGLMSIYAAVKYNKVFSKAAALSPSLWACPEQLEKLIQSKRLDPDTVIYMDYGSEEMDYRKGMDHTFCEIAGLLVQKRVHVTSRVIPNGTHTESSWEKQLPFVFSTLLYE